MRKLLPREILAYFGAHNVSNAHEPRRLSVSPQEMKNSRNPIRMPSFPRKNVLKEYRSWKNQVQVCIKTNNLDEPVKLTFLKNACKDSAAREIVSLVETEVGSFNQIMTCLVHRRTILAAPTIDRQSIVGAASHQRLSAFAFPLYLALKRSKESPLNK